MVMNIYNDTNGRYLLFKKKPTDILLHLHENSSTTYVSHISKKINCTYAHTEKILDLFVNLKIVKFKKEGRRKYVSLTEKGKKIGEGVESLLIICDEK
ncbi:MAG: hypothetical protein KAI55_00840 [Candidatus Aenigmarchaeota archaeon]|nr:hypothetical protein [Candidatus Aenigmarchaeota archaeon]